MALCYPNLGRVAFLAGCSAIALTVDLMPANAGKAIDLFSHKALIVSSSTYDRTKGAIASLTVGTTLPNKATSTTTAIAGNNYVTTWNNDTVDASYGVS